MKLNKNNIINRFLYWYLARTSWYQMPKSLCSYFWCIVVSILLLPMGILGRDASLQMYNIRGSYWTITNLVYIITFIIELFFYVLITVVGYYYYYGDNKSSPIEGWQYLWFFFNGLLVVLVVVTILGLLILLGFSLFAPEGVVRSSVIPYVSNKIQGDNPDKPKKQYILFEYIKSVKQKVCPIIEYTERE